MFPISYVSFQFYKHCFQTKVLFPKGNVSDVYFQYAWSIISVWLGLRWSLVMCIGVVKFCVSGFYCKRCGKIVYSVCLFILKVPIAKVTQFWCWSIGRTKSLYRYLLEPKIDHFQATAQSIFRSNFLKILITRDLLVQKLSPNDFRWNKCLKQL